MRGSDILRLALKNLKRRKSRAALTVIGVVIGIACIILMVSIGQSNYEEYKNTIFRGASFTCVYVNPGSGKHSQQLNDSTVMAISSLAGVKAVTPVIKIPCAFELGREKINAYANAVDFTVFSEQIKIVYGFPFASSSASPEIVVSKKCANSIIGQTSSIEEDSSAGDGNIMRLVNTGINFYLGMHNEYSAEGEFSISRGYRSKIVGISDDNASAYMNIEIAKKMIRENRKLSDKYELSSSKYSQIILWADNINSVKTIIEQLESIGLAVSSPVQDLGVMASEHASRQNLLIILGLTAILISSIGIANTMFANVLERKQEIAIYKIIGMPLNRIRLMFLIESGILGLIGGVIGVILSYITVFIINNYQKSFLLGSVVKISAEIHISPLVILASCIFSLAIGLVAGGYPVWKLTKLSPVEAVRNV